MDIYELMEELTDVVSLDNHGSIMLLRPITDGVQEWLTENTEGTWFAGGLVVEPRYVVGLLQGIAEDFLPDRQTEPDPDVEPMWH